MNKDKPGSHKAPGFPPESGSEALRAGLRVTWVGLWANLVLVVAKIAGGLLARSQGLIADGVHSLSDVFGDSLVLIGLRWGRRQADENHPFGHGRIETVTGQALGILLLAAAAWIVYQAIDSLASPSRYQPSLAAILVAVLSIVAKEILYRYTVAVGRRIHSHAVTANAWHHRTDALSSVVVLIGLLAAQVNPAWHRADAIAALIVAAFVAKVGLDIIWKAIKEVVDTAPSQEIIDEIAEKAESIDGVREAHDIKARYSGASLLVEIHIVVDPDQTVRQGHALAKAVQYHLMESMVRVDSVIVHVDPDLKSEHHG